jgi:acyl carrier protein
MSADLDTIRNAVARWVKRKPDGFDDDTSLIGGGLIDSMTIVDLIADLEDGLGIRIPTTDVRPDDFDSIRSIARTVARYVRPQGTRP